ncbi:hypothetical protein ACVWXN_002222 [Bradyrhizobium sp. i1.4.4]
MRHAELGLPRNQLAFGLGLRDGLVDGFVEFRVPLAQAARHRLEFIGRHRDLVVCPIGLLELLLKRHVVKDEADATIVLQRAIGFRLGLEGHEIDAEFLGHLLVVVGALDAADRLALQLFPLGDRRFLGRQHGRAGSGNVFRREVDDLGALGRDAERGENRIDAAGGQEFDAIGRDDRHELDLVLGAKELLGNVLRKRDLEADDVALVVQKAIGHVIILHADDELAARLDVLKRARHGGATSKKGSERNSGNAHHRFEACHPVPLDKSRPSSAVATAPRQPSALRMQKSGRSKNMHQSQAT